MCWTRSYTRIASSTTYLGRSSAGCRFTFTQLSSDALEITCAGVPVRSSRGPEGQKRDIFYAGPGMQSPLRSRHDDQARHASLANKHVYVRQALFPQVQVCSRYWAFNSRKVEFKQQVVQEWVLTELLCVVHGAVDAFSACHKVKIVFCF